MARSISGIEASRSIVLPSAFFVLTGVVAECCVLSTAFDAIDLGCEFIYVTDAVSGFDRPREDASILMLSGLSPLHGKIMDTGSYLKET